MLDPIRAKLASAMRPNADNIHKSGLRAAVEGFVFCNGGNADKEDSWTFPIRLGVSRISDPD
jgi:hypothetical protein